MERAKVFNLKKRIIQNPFHESRKQQNYKEKKNRNMQQP